MFNHVLNVPMPHSQIGMPAQTHTDQNIDVSIVVPLFNEVESVEVLYEKLRLVVDGLDKSCEIIFVDDGSADGTYSVLKEILQGDPQVWVIRLGRNFGQTAAFSAGFDLARGDVIVTLDGDMQNDPADIPRLLEKTDVGYDVVSGWRVNRKEAFLTRRFPSQVANFLISKVTGIQLHDYGCSLKAYRRHVIKNIKLYGEMHRFIPALASWAGIQVAEVPVNHFPRRFGRSKYGLGRTFKVILDLLTVKFLLDYATRPIQVFGLIGLLSFLGGTGLGLYLTIERLFFKKPLGNRPVLLLAILLAVLGVQFLVMGLLGELVVRTYYEAQDKPIYSIRDLLGGEPPIGEDGTKPQSAG
jgi:glycosyltransferase involved in cell wall biosynthesis